MCTSCLQRSTARRKNSRPSSSNAAKTAVRATRNTRWASSRPRRRRSFCPMRKSRSRNLIGNVGDGAKIAFNILNVGRFKLGASRDGRCEARDSRGGPIRERTSSVRQTDLVVSVRSNTSSPRWRSAHGSRNRSRTGRSA